MALTISPASPADVDAVAALASRTFPLACPPDLDRAVIEEFVAENLTAGAFRGYLAAAGHEVLLAHAVSGELVGYALTVAGTDMDPACADTVLLRPTVGVSKLYVDAAHHGSGAAAALLEEIERRAAERGARSLWLGTNVANARARRFYERTGFLERGGRTFVVGGVSNTDVVYEKPLRSAGED